MIKICILIPTNQYCLGRLETLKRLEKLELFQQSIIYIWLQITSLFSSNLEKLKL